MIEFIEQHYNLIVEIYVPIIVAIIGIFTINIGSKNKDSQISNKNIHDKKSINAPNQSGGSNHIGDITNNNITLFQAQLDVNDKTPPFVIIAHGGKYDETSVERIGIFRTLSVAIKNNRKNNYLPNCQLSVVYKKPDNSLGKIHLTDTITLQPEELRYVKLASCHESVDKILNPNERLRGQINLSAPHWRSAFGRPELTRNEQHTINLQLEYENDDKISIYCYLWIDDRGRLRLQQK